MLYNILNVIRLNDIISNGYNGHFLIYILSPGEQNGKEQKRVHGKLPSVFA